MTERVVVVGAGFCGLETVNGLRGADVDITLIDRNSTCSSRGDRTCAVHRPRRRRQRVAPRS
jgi:pyruvate/2-oxoglutarate dehydrogenase complex dihydrolipoamide dehydrogenase (E3) component